MIKLILFIQLFTVLAVTYGSPQTDYNPSGTTGSQFSTTPMFIHAAISSSRLSTLTGTDLKLNPQPFPKPTPSSTTQPTTKPTPGPTPHPTPKPTTPAPNPEPVPNPIMGNWSVEYENSSISCIVLDVAIQFEILDVNQTKNTRINLPEDAISNGSCGMNRSNILLAWNENKGNLEFDFMKSENGKFVLELISVKFTDKDTKTYSLVHNRTEFSTPLDNSYKCARVQTLNLTEDKYNETVAYLHMSHVQFQAFSNTSGHKFDLAVDCSSSLTTDIVPIVVGCVLAALVVMVLIAYLIGRRRCQARGYLSM